MFPFATPVSFLGERGDGVVDEGGREGGWELLPG